MAQLFINALRHRLQDTTEEQAGQERGMRGNDVCETRSGQAQVDVENTGHFGQGYSYSAEYSASNIVRMCQNMLKLWYGT